MVRMKTGSSLWIWAFESTLGSYCTSSIWGEYQIWCGLLIQMMHPTNSEFQSPQLAPQLLGSDHHHYQSILSPILPLSENDTEPVAPWATKWCHDVFSNFLPYLHVGFMVLYDWEPQEWDIILRLLVRFPWNSSCQSTNMCYWPYTSHDVKDYLNWELYASAQWCYSD